MLRSSLFLTLGLILARVSAEYVWTGTEWKWNEPGASQQIPDDTLGGTSNGGGNIEGSGAGSDYGDDQYDEEDDEYDDYTYSDNDDIDVGRSNTFNVGKTNNRGNTPVNTGILPATDDEDMIDGSGDGSVVGSGYDDRVREPVTQPPRREPEVFVDEDDDYNYNEDDYDEDEDYDDGDDIGFGGDSDYDDIHNIDVQVTAKPTPFAYPVPTEGTTRRPTHIYTDAPEVHKERPSNRPASFFAQPGILAAVIGGAVVGLLCAILLVMFIVYRMRKKDEGSYALDEPKRSHNVNSYSKPPSREFYA